MLSLSLLIGIVAMCQNELSYWELYPAVLGFSKKLLISFTDLA